MLPLLIVGGGRTGTTLLMQLLGTSPLIAFDRVYPFETRYLTYLTRWAHVLSEDYIPQTGWLVAHVTAAPDGTPVGPLPFADAALWNGRRMWERSLPAVWDIFSAQLAETAAAGGNAAPRYYAEKVPHWMPALLGTAIPFRQLVSVRDPRDMFLSISAFNKKRGFPGFGRQADDDDWTFARNFTAAVKQQFHYVRAACEADDSLIVRYEDLAGGIHAATTRLADWLGVDLDPRPVLARAGDFAAHVTSASLEDSLHRWKRELPADLNAFFASELAQELRYFSYDA